VIYIYISILNGTANIMIFLLCLINLPKIDSEDPDKITDRKRKLGLVVVRGTQVSLVSPQEGMEEIANPFIAAEE